MTSYYLRIADIDHDQHADAVRVQFNEAGVFEGLQVCATANNPDRLWTPLPHHTDDNGTYFSGDALLTHTGQMPLSTGALDGHANRIYVRTGRNDPLIEQYQYEYDNETDQIMAAAAFAPGQPHFDALKANYTSRAPTSNIPDSYDAPAAPAARVDFDDNGSTDYIRIEAYSTLNPRTGRATGMTIHAFHALYTWPKP